MDREEVWLERIGQIVEKVRALEPRFDNVDDLQRGSSLAQDDASRPNLPISHLVWYGMATSMDHLSQVADILSAGLGWRPYALFSLTRGAHLAASQSLWLLIGARAERLQRAASVYIEEFHSLQQFYNDFTNGSVLPPEVMDEFADRIRRAKDKVEELNQTQPARFYSTKMIRDTSEWLARDDPDPWHVYAHLSGWRTSSAAAHSRMWLLNVRSHTDLGSTGGRVRRIAATNTELGMAFGSAYVMMAAAVRLWDLRRANQLAGFAPVPPPWASGGPTDLYHRCEGWSSPSSRS